MTTSTGLSVRDLFAKIQGVPDVSFDLIPVSTTKKCYAAKTEIVCPILMALEGHTYREGIFFKDETLLINPQFQKLAKALLTGEVDPRTAFLSEIEGHENEIPSSKQEIFNRYPIRSLHFNSEKSTTDFVKFVAETQFAEIQEFHLQYGFCNPNFSIFLVYDNWVTATKIKLLISNLFNYTDDHDSGSTSLHLTELNKEQFLDITQFLCRNHTFSANTVTDIKNFLMHYYALKN